MEIINFNLYKKKWNITSEIIIKPGLESIQKALALLGNPQDKHKVIHVAGTNGKGSTIAFLSEIAREHGYTYGSFTSPSIIDVHDQIKINGKNVTEEQMDQAFQQVQNANLSGQLTEFELLTVIAFLVFAQKELDILFIETGMGGRFDSTNVLKKSIAVIPSISIDHTNFLGETVEQISWHKAGIMKEDSQLIIGQLEENAKTIFFQEVVQKNGSAIEYKKDFNVQNNTYTYGNNHFEKLYPNMLGNQQLSNMALAITALLESGLQITEKKVQEAVKNTNLPGRMEKVGKNFYLDGAHNQASIDALVEMIQLHFPNKRIHFVVGILKDKDYLAMLRKLEQVGSSFEFVDFDHERALPASELYKLCLHSDKCVTIDLENIKTTNTEIDGMTIVTGSFYFITELRMKTGKKHLEISDILVI